MNLDDAYSIADHTPDWDSYPPRWSAASAELRAALGERAEIGVPYGPSDRQVYDLFRPDGPSVGTVVFVHGGYWKAFDRTSWSYLAAGPLALDRAVAMVGYDLCPDVKLSEITMQVTAAIVAIAQRTTGPLALTGHSAGGHLVARMCAPGMLPDAVRARITQVVPIAPLADLEPLLQTSMNDTLRLDLAEAQAESPVRQPAPGDIGVTVWVGADERPALLEQARRLAEVWDVVSVVVPGKHHFDVIDALVDPDSDLVRLLCGVGAA